MHMGMQMLCHENRVLSVTETVILTEVTLVLIKDQNTAIPAR